MTDAQAGLVVATPIIIVFAIVLNRMGVLQRIGAMMAVICSVATRGHPFLNQ